MIARRYIWPIVYGLSILPFVYLWADAITSMLAARSDPDSTCWIVETNGMFVTPVGGAGFLSIYGYGIWLAAWLVAFFFLRKPNREREPSWILSVFGLALMLYAVAFVASETLNAPYLEIARTHCEWP